MKDRITEPLLETINYAIEKKVPHLLCDFTLICKVTKIYSNDLKRYQLQHRDTFYDVTTNNIPLKLHDTVHLMIPEGNFSNKYILEDAAMSYFNRLISAQTSDISPHKEAEP